MPLWGAKCINGTLCYSRSVLDHYKLGVILQCFEVALKSGIAIVREDELDELIQTLTDIRQSLPRRTSAEMYVDYEMAKGILRQEFANDEMRLTRRFGRLWSAIARVAMNDDITYDAYCAACATQLAEHSSTASACYGMIGSSANMVVSANSLRYCKSAFLGKRVNQVGDAVRNDYVYLVKHLPTI